VDLNEEDLTVRAIQGDEQALADLLELAGPAVRECLKGLIPSRLQSLLSDDDVMQQTYVDAFLGIRQFTPRGSNSFVAWLKTLANRNLMDVIRMLEAAKRGGNNRQVGLDEDRSLTALYEVLGATTSTPSRRAAGREAQLALLQAISRLPDLQQQVIRLYDLEGKPVQDVASAMNRSQGAVFMLRARAHDRLREIMGSASDYLSTNA